MNIGFVEVFTPHTAVCEGDFNKLFVPFRCVTSDVFNKKKVVMSKGDLGEAVRMSMTFPVAFKPIERMDCRCLTGEYMIIFQWMS